MEIGTLSPHANISKAGFSFIEFRDWDEQKFLDFYTFCEMFTVYDDKLKYMKWACNNEKVSLVNDLMLKSENTNISGFIRRVDRTKGREFIARLQQMERSVGTYLKRNPAFVTPAVEEKIEGNAKFQWVLRHFQVDKRTNALVPNPSGGSGNQPLVIGRDMEIQMMESHQKLVDIYSKLIKGISPNDLKNASLEEKMKYIKDLAPIVKNVKNFRPANVNVFMSNQNNSENLEKSLLAYAQDQSKKADGKEE